MNNIDPGWDVYRTFLSVVQEGSLSGAARALGLTQPTIGRHVDALETALACQLFTRSPSGLLPTEAALALRPYAEDMAAMAEALRRTAGEQGGAVTGAVRISASEIVGAEVLPPILTRLRADHPHLRLELDLSNTVADLLRRDVDIAVRMTEPAQDALIVRRLGAVEIGLYAHPGYIERRGAPDTPDALTRHDVIGYATETPATRLLRRTQSWTDGLRFALASDNQLFQLNAVRAGFGIGFAQARIAHRDGLVRILPEIGFSLPVCIAMHEDLKTTPRCRATFDALVEGLGAYLAG